MIKWPKQQVQFLYLVMMTTSQIKYICLDFDGVISPGKYFSEIYAAKFGVAVEQLLPFFQHKKKLANLGQADMKQLLAEELAVWQWSGSVDQLCDFWFESDADIDPGIAQLANRLRQQGKKIYLTTDQEKYRTEFIWHKRGLKQWMDGRFVSFELGCEKKQVCFWQKVFKKLKAEPSEILMVDDSVSKLKVASSQGIHTIRYIGLPQLIDVLAQWEVLSQD